MTVFNGWAVVSYRDQLTKEKGLKHCGAFCESHPAQPQSGWDSARTTFSLQASFWSREVLIQNGSDECLPRPDSHRGRFRRQWRWLPVRGGRGRCWWWGHRRRGGPGDSVDQSTTAAKIRWGRLSHAFVRVFLIWWKPLCYSVIWLYIRKAASALPPAPCYDFVCSCHQYLRRDTIKSVFLKHFYIQLATDMCAALLVATRIALGHVCFRCPGRRPFVMHFPVTYTEGYMWAYFYVGSMYYTRCFTCGIMAYICSRIRWAYGSKSWAYMHVCIYKLESVTSLRHSPCMIRSRCLFSFA